MKSAFLIAGLRTPFARSFKGALADVRPDDLLIELIDGHQQRFTQPWTAIPEELIVGCAYPEGEQGYNVARMVALGAGLDIPGITVNRLCASSLDAAGLAASKIRAGFARSLLVGGLESMSRIPRRGANFSQSETVQRVSQWAYITNGETAERVAAAYPHLSRLKQEDFAAASHELADAAYSARKYDGSIHAWPLERDELIRVPVDRDKMASLPSAFSKEGVVTAATSSPLTDGATLALIVDEVGWKDSGESVALEIIDWTTSHVSPDIMGMGPVPATEKLLKRNHLSVSDIAVWEMNEAFAIQVLACVEELGINPQQLNRWGGALALGHPLGASGLRLLITLICRLADGYESGTLGVATLCVGGGQGVSMLGRLVRC
jgi:acetyl-CoA acyltransferase